jgi:hypothetical protein
VAPAAEAAQPAARANPVVRNTDLPKHPPLLLPPRGGWSPPLYRSFSDRTDLFVRRRKSYLAAGERDRIGGKCSSALCSTLCSAVQSSLYSAHRNRKRWTGRQGHGVRREHRHHGLAAGVPPAGVSRDCIWRICGKYVRNRVRNISVMGQTSAIIKGHKSGCANLCVMAPARCRTDHWSDLYQYGEGSIPPAAAGSWRPGEGAACRQFPVLLPLNSLWLLRYMTK